MRSRIAALDLRKKEVIVVCDCWLMEVNWRVAMCNEAAAQQLYTRGNNEVLLRHFFQNQPLLC
jgi:hypothetical protein